MQKKIIYLIVFAIIILLLILLNIVKFSINGEEKIYLIEGSNYFEQGYEAKTLFGKNINNKVKMKGNVNTNIIGKYYIDYNLKYFFVKKTLRREIEVVKNNIDVFETYLVGEPIIYQNVGEKYEEKGAYVLNKVTGKKDFITIMNGKVNINEAGEYEIRYTHEYNGDKKEITRKVVVYEFNEEIIEEIDDKNVLVSIELLGVNNIDYILLPNGKKEFSNKISYEMGDNSKYTFKIYTKDGQEIIHEINMNSSSDYKCEGKIDRDGTRVEIIGNNGLDVRKYQWIVDGQEVVAKSRYINSNSIHEAKVTITLRSGLTLERTCEIKDELMYHFKYDENNSKPVIRCNTYTTQDRTDLEEKLRLAVEQAGYGSRAGVVEAARFLVGALDYKIPYLGPKEVNDLLGRYKKPGLNIANSNGWGCNVSGWIQGIDCTNFIEWAYAQNGINTHPYVHGYNKTSDVITALRVGDLLFTPCVDDCADRKYGLTHVGIIIGIDENYFYVAESTTGSINAVVVSKWDKNNMPTKGKFSLAKVFDYVMDGNLTSMWVE